jgi:hypothetical protein
MSVNITIEYNENLTPIEVEQLRELEAATYTALRSHAILGRARWTAKLDPSRRSIFALERVTGGSGMLTYYAPHELSHLNPDLIDRHIFRDRHSYIELLSDRPLIFECLTSSQRADIVNFRRDITVLVPCSATELGNISSYPRAPSMPTHVEVAPTPVALSGSATAQIMVHTPLGLKGAWQRLFIATYHESGRIFFREIDAETIEAVFRFQ